MITIVVSLGIIDDGEDHDGTVAVVVEGWKGSKDSSQIIAEGVMRAVAADAKEKGEDFPEHELVGSGTL